MFYLESSPTLFLRLVTEQSNMGISISDDMSDVPLCCNLPTSQHCRVNPSNSTWAVYTLKMESAARFFQI